MNDAAQLTEEDRVLVLAPTTWDAVLIRSILTQAGLPCQACPDLDFLCQELGEDTDAVVVIEEVLTGEGPERLMHALRQQPEWSDLPVLLLAAPGADSPLVDAAPELFGNVTILERPIRLTPLASALRTALKVRRRQYQLRDQMVMLAQAREARQASELTLRRVMERLPAGAYTCDPDGLITSFNQQAAQLWGRVPKLNDPADRFCGSLRLFGTDGVPIAHDQCWMALALRVGDEYNGREIVIERPDSARFTVLAHASPIHDEFGKLLGAVNVVVDVTESRALMAERDRLLERLRLQIDRLPLAYMLLDRNQHVLDWNPQAERLFGYTKKEMLGQVALPDLLVPRPAIDHVQQIIHRVSAGDMNAHSINQNQTKDGRIITCSWFNTPIMDSDGRFDGVICLVKDITERQRAEDRLRESEERFHQLAANIEGYFWLNAPDDSQMYYMSPGYEKITGRKCDSLYRSPRSWTDIIHPDDRARILAAGTVEQARQFEYRIVRPDGSVRWLRDRVFPVRDERGNIYRVAGIGEDITERKQAEVQLSEYANRVQTLASQLMETQEAERRRLARELHDEVGQALTAIKMNLQAVQNEPMAAASARRLQDGIEVVTRVLGQVRNLSLDYWPIMLEDLGLGDALESYVDRQAQRWQIKMRFAKALSSNAVPCPVALACFRVAQEALTNIARHARAQNGSVELCQTDTELRLTVQDDGVGFNPATMRSSVGLQSMRERVSLLGGQFAIDSAPAQGTIVRVCFPLAISAKGNGK